MLGLARTTRPRLVATHRGKAARAFPQSFELRLIVYVDPLSDQNPLVKQIRRAVARGTLTEDGHAVAEGVHLIEEAVRARCDISAVILSESAKPGLLSTNSEGLSGLPEARVVSEKTFRSLSSTETPQGVLALVKPPRADAERIFGGDALVVILDGIQEPGNAGAIVRVAEAFGATGAVFLKGTVDPFHPRVLRGSAGSSFRLPVLSGHDLERSPEAFGKLRIYAAIPPSRGNVPGAERSSAELRDADFTIPCAVAIGAEARGISAQLAACSTAVYIPTRNVESLNAAVAAGIFLYEARRQRDARKPNSSPEHSR